MKSDILDSFGEKRSSLLVARSEAASLKVDPMHAWRGNARARGVAGSTKRGSHLRVGFPLQFPSTTDDITNKPRQETLDLTLDCQKELIINPTILSLGLRIKHETSILSNLRRATEIGASRASGYQQTRLQLYGRTPSAGICRAHKKKQYATTTKAFNGQIALGCASFTN